MAPAFAMGPDRASSSALSSASPKESSSRRGFTLVELIAVMTLIALFAGVLGYAFMSGGSSTVGLQAAQSTISGLLTLARSHAATSGKQTAVLVLVGSGTFNPDRYLRYLVPVVWSEDDSEWHSLTTGVVLPQGCYVVPPTTGPSMSPAPAYEPSGGWSDLESGALKYSKVDRTLNSTDPTEDWRGVRFTPRGTTGDNGRIVVATARVSPPVTAATTPITFVNPENVRGVSISQYGLIRLINSADDF